MAADTMQFELVDESPSRNIRNMEETFPDACWRYSDSHNFLLRPQWMGSGSAETDFMAYISYVVSPVEFYLQPSFLVPKIHRYIDQLSDYYEKSISAVAADDIFTNMPCAVQFCEDDKWYRAVVIEKGSEDARVSFVDWGNSQFARLDNIKPLHHAFGRLPPLAIKCRLHGSKERSLFQKKIDEFMEELDSLYEKRVLCIPVGFSANDVCITVRLINPITKESIGHKYLPTEPICPYPIEYYEKKIKELDDLNQYIDCAEPNQKPEAETSEASKLADNGMDERKSKPDIGSNVAAMEPQPQKPFYNNDLEAFLDGALSVNGSESDEEQEQELAMRPRSKKLKQMKLEARLKAQGKWPPSKCNDQRRQDDRRQFSTADGRHWVGSLAKAVKPPKGLHRVVVHHVQSSREIYLRLDVQVGVENILTQLTTLIN